MKAVTAPLSLQNKVGMLGVVEGNTTYGWAPGHIGSSKVVLMDDGSITADKSAYFDDIVAATAALISTNPNMDPNIVALLRFAVEAADRRAVARHGFSGSPDEQVVQWKYMDNEQVQALTKWMLEQTE